MKNIFIAATGKDVGKSTISFALLDLLMQDNKKVAFIKPVGQRWLHSKWGKIDEDVILMKQIFQFPISPPFMNPIVVEKGYTEDYLNKIVKPNLTRKILNAYEKISENNEYVIIGDDIQHNFNTPYLPLIQSSEVTIGKYLSQDIYFSYTGQLINVVDQLNDQFDDINSEVLYAIETESTTYLLSAFDRVEADMPELIQKLESLPPQSKRRRQSWATFIRAAQTYILSCQYLKKNLEKNVAIVAAQISL